MEVVLTKHARTFHNSHRWCASGLAMVNNISHATNHLTHPQPDTKVKETFITRPYSLNLATL